MVLLASFYLADQQTVLFTSRMCFFEHEISSRNFSGAEPAPAILYPIKTSKGAVLWDIAVFCASRSILISKPVGETYGDLARKTPAQLNQLHTKRRGRSTITSELVHLQGVGRFASDAWRIFCKDEMYEQAGYSVIRPEWEKVLPVNQGLAAYLCNRWEREGFGWVAFTGHLQKRGFGSLA